MNRLRQLRHDKGLRAVDMVEVVRAQFPKYDKTIQSKAERTEDYGVVLAPTAMNLLYGAYGRPKENRHGKHRFTCRIQCRLPECDYQQLQQRIQAEGYHTIQEWLTDMVGLYLAQKGAESGNE